MQYGYSQHAELDSTITSPVKNADFFFQKGSLQDVPKKLAQISASTFQCWQLEKQKKTSCLSAAGVCFRETQREPL